MTDSLTTVPVPAKQGSRRRPPRFHRPDSNYRNDLCNLNSPAKLLSLSCSRVARGRVVAPGRTPRAGFSLTLPSTLIDPLACSGAFLHACRGCTLSVGRDWGGKRCGTCSRGGSSFLRAANLRCCVPSQGSCFGHQRFCSRTRSTRRLRQLCDAPGSSGRPLAQAQSRAFGRPLDRVLSSYRWRVLQGEHLTLAVVRHRDVGYLPGSDGSNRRRLRCSSFQQRGYATRSAGAGRLWH